MNVLAVAGDPGCANALAPVIRQLLEIDKVGVTCLAYAQATHLWEAAGFQPRPIEQIDLHPYDRLLIGTPLNKDQRELPFILSAQAERIPTLSILDSWIYYWERFTMPDGRRVLPDAIAIMDEQARREMIEVGFPSDCLHVTGQPAFDELRRYDDPGMRIEMSGEVRRLAGCQKDEPCILYVSQPLSQIPLNETLGFDDREVLADLVLALEKILGRRSAKASLLIKLHPRESRTTFLLPKIQSSRLRIKVIENTSLDARQLVLGSDLVFGMNSILLMDACLLKKPVLSYQPNLRRADPLPANLYGWSRAVYDRSILEQLLEAELFDSVTMAKRRRQLEQAVMPSGATQRVIELMGVPVA